VLLLHTMCAACAVPLDPACTAHELTKQMRATATQVQNPYLPPFKMKPVPLRIEGPTTFKRLHPISQAHTRGAGVLRR
jgi:hypothetical protein